MTYIWFYQMVRNHGPWDYKQGRAEYANLAIFITVPLVRQQAFLREFCSGGQVLHRFSPGQAILPSLRNSRTIIITVMTQSISYG